MTRSPSDPTQRPAHHLGRLPDHPGSLPTEAPGTHLAVTITVGFVAQ